MWLVALEAVVAFAAGATPFPGLTINSIAVDSTGATIVAGTTTQAGLPVTANAIQSNYDSSYACTYIGFPRLCNDAYVAKVATDGTILYATYLGGSSDDASTSVAVDEMGSIYLVGTTSSVNFPFTAQPANATGPFLAKIAADGTLVFAQRMPAGVTVHKVLSGGGGEIVLGGECTPDSMTWTATFYASKMPTYGGACYVRLAPNGTDIVASTILSGSEEALAMDITLDSAGNAYMTGSSFSKNFPTTATSWIATTPQEDYDFTLFAAAVSRDGTTLLGSALFNGEQYDSPSNIAVNAAGEVFVAGKTESSRFPVTPGAFQTVRLGQDFTSNAFILKLKADFSAPVFSTYLGGELDETVSALESNSDGSVTLIGTTDSALFPTTVNGAYRCLTAGYYPTFESFLTQLAPDGQSLVYSTFLNEAVVAATFQNVWTLALGNGGIATLDPSLLPSTPQFCAMNAADFVGTAITSGEILTMFGSGLAGAQILFNGQPGTVLYSSDGQVNAIVPDGFATRSTAMIEAANGGTVVGSVNMPVAVAVAGLFRNFGTPIIVANNDDGTPVNEASPAQPGSIIRIYGTGFGSTSPTIRIGGSAAPPLSSTEANGVTEFRVLVPGGKGLPNQLSVDFTLTGIAYQTTGLYLPVAVGN